MTHPQNPAVVLGDFRDCDAARRRGGQRALYGPNATGERSPIGLLLGDLLLAVNWLPDRDCNFNRSPRIGYVAIFGLEVVLCGLGSEENRTSDDDCEEQSHFLHNGLDGGRGRYAPGRSRTEKLSDAGGP